MKKYSVFKENIKAFLLNLRIKYRYSYFFTWFELTLNNIIISIQHNIFFVVKKVFSYIIIYLFKLKDIKGGNEKYYEKRMG